MPTGRTPSKLLSSLATMTRNGAGTKARIMITSDRHRPRDASAWSSSSRLASCSNCSSLFIADLQVGDRLRGIVEDALDGGAVDTTAQLADAIHEPVENGLPRGLGLERSARAGFDPRKHDALVGQHVATVCRHAIRRLPSAQLLLDELLGSQRRKRWVDASGGRPIARRAKPTPELAQQLVAALWAIGDEFEEDERQLAWHEEL